MIVVVCINTPVFSHPPLTLGDSILEIGKRYNVVDECVHSKAPGLSFYELAEDIGHIYATKLFAPCSDIDETEYAESVLEKIFTPAYTSRDLTYMGF